VSSTLDTVVDLDILDIADTWSFWERPIPASVRRDADLPESLRDSLCLVIQGVRRCGKSTLLQQLLERYQLDPKLCAFLNLEDPRLAGAQSYGTLDRLVAQFRERHARAERLYFFLDEIQGVEGWQRWLRSQLDRPRGNHFVITGSNARLLSGELSSVLTGRHLTVELYPFDLVELRRRDPDATLEGYLLDGGFPEPLEMADGDRLLRQYLDDIVERDVRERIGARSSAAIRQVVQLVYESAGSELSLRRVAGATGITADTAGNYLEACEAAYLLFACPYFTFSERKRSSRNRKYYPVDTGLRRVVVTHGGADRGKSLECATYLALRRRYGEVSYWRGAGEVDFVTRVDGRIVPFQVTWDEPLDRDHRALESFYESHPQADEAMFVTAARFESTLSTVGGAP
jgi:predicted AAA+ superfamily ATPase